MFTSESRAILAMHKYTQWVTSLTDDQLVAFLHACGEFFLRVGFDQELMVGLIQKLESEHMHPRGVAGLRFMLDLARGRPPGHAEVEARMREEAFRPRT